MSGVEALSNAADGSALPPNPQPSEAISNEAQIDAALAEVWDRQNDSTGSARDENGRFTSANANAADGANGEGGNGAEGNAADAGNTNSLEGEGGEGGQDGSTPGSEIPLPAFLKGKDALWASVPAEQKPEMAAHLNDLNVRMSKMGQQVSQYQPLMDVAAEFSEYWNGMIDQGGNPLPPAEGVRYLANIQRSMDRDPFNTLLSIADTYNLRPQLAKAFGGQVQQVPQDQQALLQEIAGLKEALRARPDVSAEVNEAISRRDQQSELQAFAQSKPLWNHVADDLPFFISKAKTQLGGDAGRTAVLSLAYDLAVQADPALRQLAAATKVPAGRSKEKAESAKRAASVNAPSSTPGKAKELSLDDELAAVWESHQ